jgi:GxxExxY protein
MAFLMTENEIARQIVDAAYKVQTTLGPGLFESVYEAVMAEEMARRGLRFVRQRAIPVVYGTVKLDIGFRADIIVEGKVIVEIKSIEAIARLSTRSNCLHICVWPTNGSDCSSTSTRNS